MHENRFDCNRTPAMSQCFALFILSGGKMQLPTLTMLSVPSPFSLVRQRTIRWAAPTQRQECAQWVIPWNAGLPGENEACIFTVTHTIERHAVGSHFMVALGLHQWRCHNRYRHGGDTSHPVSTLYTNLMNENNLPLELQSTPQKHNHILNTITQYLHM